MIIWDTEATGIVKPLSVPLAQQPEIIEFAAVKLDDRTLEEVARVEFLARPQLMWPLHEQITKWTNITSEMLESQPSFAGNVARVVDLVLGERVWIAHNISYDLSVMTVEMMRLSMMARFPWPPEPVCTVELTLDLEVPRTKSDRLKLGELYKHLTGRDIVGAHRAMNDVMALVDCVRELRKLDGRI